MMPQSQPNSDLIRPATANDLPAIYQVWYTNEVGDDPDPPARGPGDWLHHELETGELVVAERDGQIIGFAATITRSDITFLAECFVLPSVQSAGIGHQLLQHLLPRDRQTYCTLSSRDGRALALYIRAGMRPRWPTFCLHAETSRLSELPIGDVELVAAEPGDPALVQWDAEICGRYRPAEHTYWVTQTAAIPLWFQRHGQTIGYGYAQMRTPEALWFPDAITLGPIGARNADDARACVGAAVQWARSQTPTIHITVPGPHTALTELLDARFHITYVETYVASNDEPFMDARCYIPSGSTLF